MKKAFRAIVAALLAAIMALSGISAFAAEEKGNIGDWYLYEEDLAPFVYEGELSVGKNTVILPTDKETLYYTFAVENSGFYAISALGENDFWYCIPEKIENKIADELKEREYFYDIDKDFSLYYLEKGEYILGIVIDYIDPNEETYIEIDFFGETLDKITIDEELVIGVDYYYYSEPDSEHFFELYADVVTYTFSTGKTAEGEYADGYPLSAPVSGINTINVEFLGEYCTTQVNLIDLNDIIADVEIANIEDCLYRTEYYDGYDCIYPYFEDLTVTFTDGTKVKAEYDEYDYPYIKISDNKTIFFYYSFEETDGDCTFNINVGDNIIKSYECKTEKANFSDNFSALISNSQYYLSRSFYWVKQAIIRTLECDSIYEFNQYGRDNVIDALSLSLDWFLDIFRSIERLIFYYLG